MTPRRVAQREYDALRAAAASRWSVLASKRLVVLPDSVMRITGGAAVVYRWTCVCPRLLDAPAPILRAILAHEWGHVARGHSLATMAALVCAVAGVALPAVGAVELVRQALSIFALSLIAWVLSARREFEADDVAAQLVGRAALADGIRWVMTTFHPPGYTNTKAQQRLARLEPSG